MAPTIPTNLPILPPFLKYSKLPTVKKILPVFLIAFANLIASSYVLPSLFILAISKTKSPCTPVFTIESMTVILAFGYFSKQFSFATLALL